MERQDIDDELARTGAQELLTSTSMVRLAYIGEGRNTAGDPDRLLLDRRRGTGDGRAWLSQWGFGLR